MTSEYTKIQVYRACVVSTLLYGSESWTLRTQQERRINAFHMRQILHIAWQDRMKSQNSSVLERAGIVSMENLHKESVPQADPNYASRVCAKAKRFQGLGCQPHHMENCSRGSNGLEADC